MRLELRKQLIRSGMISEDQMRSAEHHASSSGVSVDKALVVMNYVRPSDLGQCMSTIYSMPYYPLKEKELSPAAKTALSRECAVRWNVCPVAYDPTANLLTLAVSEPDRAARMQKIFSFFLESHEIAFSIAPESEIVEKIAEIFGAPDSAEKPAEQKSVPETKSASVEKQPTGPAPTAEKPGEKKAPSRDLNKTEFEQDDMAHHLFTSLLSAVSLLVRAHLADDETALARAGTRARYCRLLAGRQGLSADETARLNLAAWMSSLDHKPEVITQFVSPYDIDSLLFSKEEEPRESRELHILSLVKSYQNFEEESPEECRDVNMVRRGMHVRWRYAADHQEVLETFLQVLMDEQFLDKFAEFVGTILVVDPTGTAVSEIKTPLTRAGYKVNSVSNVATSRVFLGHSSVDLIILDADALAEEVVAFCRDWKGDSATRDVPIVVIMSEKSDQRGTRFLRAGADDFLTLPVDMELLHLKVQRLLASSPVEHETAKEGVNGSLSDLSFSDMLQVLSAGCKSMEIDVSREGESGKVILREGDVIHAEAGEEKGENAFYQLMRWHEGEFQMKACSEFPEPSITSSTMSLLMEGARLADESAA